MLWCVAGAHPAPSSSTTHDERQSHCSWMDGWKRPLAFKHKFFPPFPLSAVPSRHHSSLHFCAVCLRFDAEAISVARARQSRTIYWGCALGQASPPPAPAACPACCSTAQFAPPAWQRRTQHTMCFSLTWVCAHDLWPLLACIIADVAGCRFIQAAQERIATLRV